MTTFEGLQQAHEKIGSQQAEIDRLRSAIIRCLKNNGHLADGEVCTLIDLKRAVPEWELEDE